MLELSFKRAALWSTATFILAVSCSQKEDEKASLDKSISDQVAKLPGVRKTSEYSRYYAKRNDGNIVGVYIIYHEDSRAYVKSFCDEGSVSHYPCNRPDFGVIDPGDVLWLNEPENLPLRAGGGCSYVRFTFDIRSFELADASCNAAV